MNADLLFMHLLQDNRDRHHGFIYRQPEQGRTVDVGQQYSTLLLCYEYFKLNDNGNELKGADKVNMIID